MCTVEVLRTRQSMTRGRDVQQNTQEDQSAAAPTQYNVLTKEQRERVARKWHLVQTSRDGHYTTKTTNHQEYSLASRLKPKSTESPKSFNAPRRDKSRARTPSQNSQWPSSSSSTASRARQWSWEWSQSWWHRTFQQGALRSPDRLHSKERQRSGRR